MSAAGVARAMKPVLPLAIVLALLAPAALASPVLDQLRNGDLESWSAPYAPEGWTVVVGNVTRSAFATEGGFSAQLRAKPNELGGHFSVMRQAIPQSGTDLPIMPGAFYDLSFDAAGVYNGKGNGHATITWLGVTGKVLRVDTIVVPDGVGYASYTARLQAPIDVLGGDAATSALVAFVVDGQSSDSGVNLWVDDVAFGPGSPA